MDELVLSALAKLSAPEFLIILLAMVTIGITQI